MNHDKTGGPAFPVPPNDSKVSFPTGMTLWDWYAGHALAGMLSDGEECAPFLLAECCANVADAMLAERKKRGIV